VAALPGFPGDEIVSGMRQAKSHRITPGAVMHVLAVERYDAVIFDLDGVVTDTAGTHAAAWKHLFDDFLRERAEETGEPFRPFDIDADYVRYVDGKPRHDGVASFLESRGIHLPLGSPDDPPDRQTIHGLGNRKNRYFLDRVASGGVEVFPTTVRLIESLRAAGVRTALVSSSRNAGAILDAAGLRHLFYTVIDGNDLARLGLEGKPAPDLFLAAAEQLDVRPDRAAVVEDAISGVQAGRRGRFALVIGVDRRGSPDALREAGADIVVRDLGEIGVSSGPAAEPAAAGHDLPNAGDRIDAIERRLEGRRALVFLDYDGTLTPIVARPELAVMDTGMRETLRRLAAVATVAIVSGRDLEDVRRMVGLDGIAYAGSHGFDIITARGERVEHAEGARHADAVTRAAQRLAERTSAIAGALVEPKRFAVAVHYRQVAEADIPALEAVVDEVLASEPGLHKTHGKKVFELRPVLDWDKGRAVLWLIDALAGGDANVLPFYIGDDETDEDAFRALAEVGITIFVGPPRHDTAAHFRLADPAEVGVFLRRLTELLGNEAAA